ncbi:Tetratricopeptide repeat-containing protein [Ekhidna lutea]|uniref:Tetratricopeptide repeat-containing protein n=1 Tax=Ekhidna lutea TaxID=447679 RepID=A0A239H658_EKHLU|nr:tetratricopeptide repeat protein [Ekhidna lutea]SNS75764.1 Tetratricopeptide repeat-containing protein [Ekhidna lutea]
MSRVVQFPVSTPEHLGPKKARRRRKPNLEDYGQLNMFDQLPDNTPILSLPKAGSFFEEALQLDEEGNKDAEKYYLLAIENDQSVEDALCNLGILKSGQGDLTKAIDHLTQCLKRNPRHFEAHYNLGNVYSDLGNLELAKVHYELSAEIEPEYPNSYYNLGLVLISLKKYKEAIQSINKFVELAPRSEHQTANEIIKTLNAIAK